MNLIYEERYLCFHMFLVSPTRNWFRKKAVYTQNILLSFHLKAVLCNIWAVGLGLEFNAFPVVQNVCIAVRLALCIGPWHWLCFAVGWSLCIALGKSPSMVARI